MNSHSASFSRHYSVAVGRVIRLAHRGRGVHGYRSSKQYDFGGPSFFVPIAGIVVRMGVHSANALHMIADLDSGNRDDGASGGLFSDCPPDCKLAECSGAPDAEHVSAA
jgi:hypothetical protein